MAEQDRKLLYQVFDGYRIVERIGRGGVAEVYRAESITSGSSNVAFKVMLADRSTDVQAVRQFVAEYEVLQQLSHPCIPKAIISTKVEKRPAIVMSYFPGPTLYALLHAQKNFDRVSAFAALASVTAYIHSERMLHGDLKLENTIVRTDGRLGLVDFGNSTKVSATSLSGILKLKKKGPVFGTPTYIAPERLKGGQANLASDVYSLGVCGYMLLAGRAPFGDLAGRELLDAALSRRPASLHQQVPQLPKALTGIIDACLNPDPEMRPDDATIVRNLLRERGIGKGRGSRPASEEVAVPPR